MPTGYTAKIPEGQPFRDFVLSAARAMGALIHMRDDRTDAPLRPREVGTYYAEQIQQTTREIKHLEAMSSEEAEAEASRWYEKSMARYHERIAEIDAEEAAYRTMEREVRAWVPPTPEHEDFKRFMLSQIEETVRFDCSKRYLAEPLRVSGDDWKAQRLESARRTLKNASESHAEEIERVARTNAWIDALVASLPGA